MKAPHPREHFDEAGGYDDGPGRRDRHLPVHPNWTAGKRPKYGTMGLEPEKSQGRPASEETKQKMGVCHEKYVVPTIDQTCRFVVNL